MPTVVYLEVSLLSGAHTSGVPMLISLVSKLVNER